MFHDRWSSVPTLNEFDRLFDRFFHRAAPALSLGAWPRLNVHDDAETIVVRAELPGVDPSKVEVHVEDDVLVLSGERPSPESARAVRRERWTGSFRREVALATRVDLDKVEARYVDGVLTVRLPKAAEAKPRLVEIHTN
ncbi:MAG: Hsp20/alpha crystallin family protein [Planctomycetota bacterium JB042]